MADTDLSQSLEDYLEAILRVSRENQSVRISDIAARIGYSMPSVTGAINNLRAAGLVDHEPYETVKLTPRGEKIARDIENRHQVLFQFLTEVLGLNPEESEKEACQMEHAMSPESLKRLTEFIERFQNCPMQDSEPGVLRGGGGRGGRGWGPGARRPVTLNDLKPGQCGVITKVRGGSGPLKRRLMEMGFTPGAMVKMQRAAPLDDPIEVVLKGYHVSLRREEAVNIAIDPYGKEPVKEL